MNFNGSFSYLSMNEITKDVCMTQVSSCRCTIRVMVNTISLRTECTKDVICSIVVGDARVGFDLTDIGREA